MLSDELRTDDRRSLGDADFELLGVSDATERARLVQRLHEATALHFRSIRVIEIEKQEQRARTASRRFSVLELAADAWDAAELPPHNGPRIIYGEGCRLGPARLKREGIVFRQIPYEIKVS